MLHKHTWEGHIGFFHPEVTFDHVQDTLSDPDYVCASATVPGDWVFVCEGNTNELGDVMRVAVAHRVGVNLVTSAYYSAAQRHGTVIWERGDG